MTIVLGVEPALWINGEGGIGGADREIREDLEVRRAEFASMPLPDHVDIAVFALNIDPSIAVDGGRIDAPFESIRVTAIIHTVHPAIRISMTNVSLNALELPLRVQVGVNLRNEKWACWY